MCKVGRKALVVLLLSFSHLSFSQPESCGSAVYHGHAGIAAIIASEPGQIWNTYGCGDIGCYIQSCSVHTCSDAWSNQAQACTADNDLDNDGLPDSATNAVEENAIDNSQDNYAIDDEGNIWELTESNCPEGSQFCMGTWQDTGVDEDDDLEQWPDGNYIEGDGLGEDSIQGFDLETGSIDYEVSAFDRNADVSELEARVEQTGSIETDLEGTTTVTTDTTITPDGDQVETTTTQRDNNDGTSTTRTETRTIDSTTNRGTTTVTETHDDGQGNVTTTLSGSSDQGLAESEEDGATGNSSGECSSRPSCSDDSPECALLIQQWEMMCMGEFVQPEDTGFTDQDQRIEDKKAEFQAVMDQIKSEADSLLSLTVSGSGALSENNVDVRGVQVDFSLTKFQSQLALIGPMIIAVAYVLAAFIILRS